MEARRLQRTLVGPCYGELTPSMSVLQMVLDGGIFMDTRFSFHFVDVREVANAMVTAFEKGGAGERYILSNEIPMTLKELVRLTPCQSWGC